MAEEGLHTHTLTLGVQQGFNPFLGAVDLKLLCYCDSQGGGGMGGKRARKGRLAGDAS